MPSVAAMKFRRVVHMLAFFVKFSKAARLSSFWCEISLFEMAW